MNRPDVVSLITETVSGSCAYGVHATTTSTKREVMCEVRSVTRSEYYTALNAGIQPEIVFVLALEEEYQGERFVEYHGKKYRVIRTYVNDEDGIEITAERSDVN